MKIVHVCDFHRFEEIGCKTCAVLRAIETGLVHVDAMMGEFDGGRFCSLPYCLHLLLFMYQRFCRADVGAQTQQAACLAELFAAAVPHVQ